MVKGSTATPVLVEWSSSAIWSTRPMRFRAGQRRTDGGGFTRLRPRPHLPGRCGSGKLQIDGDDSVGPGGNTTFSRDWSRITTWSSSSLVNQSSLTRKPRSPLMVAVARIVSAQDQAGRRSLDSPRNSVDTCRQVPTTTVGT